MKKICSQIIFAVFFSNLFLYAAPTVTVTNDISFTIGAADLSSGAGTDFNSTKATAADAQTIDVSNAAGLSWRIDASASIGTFPSGSTLSVKVSSDGSGATGLSTQSTYLQLTGSGQEIASGTGNHSSMGLQYQLGGIDLADFSAGTPSGTITITITQV